MEKSAHYIRFKQLNQHTFEKQHTKRFKRKSHPLFFALQCSLFNLVLWFYHELHGRFPNATDSLDWKAFIEAKKIDANWLDQSLVG